MKIFVADIVHCCR